MKVYIILKHYMSGDLFEYSTSTTIFGVFSDIPSVPYEERSIDENGFKTVTYYEVKEFVVSNPYAMQF